MANGNRSRRISDTISASRINYSSKDVIQIVIWVLSLAAAWYGVQGKLSEIQSSIAVISTEMKGDNKLSEREDAARDAKIHDLELNLKAYDIRIRNLETDNAKRSK